MINELDEQVITMLDAICNQGCDYVNSCIETLVSNGVPEQTRDLSDRQRESLLEELQTIMAVYHERQGC